MSAQSRIPGWTAVYSGKVRELYQPDDPQDQRLLLVASDRVSAFDHILSPEIPGKGELLTRLSNWWFDRFPDIPNHRLPGQDPQLPRELSGRSMLVRRLRMHPIECVVRGYLTGSGWAEYRSAGTVCGIPLPPGLRDGDRLPQPLYTPAFKAPLGEHDENITFERSAEIVGAEVAAALRERSLEIFARASAIAEARGVILADTKFEFGDDPDSGELTLADEVLTSDSSRYWDAQAYAHGSTPAQRMASFDKQIVRDWLAAHWDSSGEPPRLPAEVVQRTAARYRELLDRLTS